MSNSNQTAPLTQGTGTQPAWSPGAPLTSATALTVATVASTKAMQVTGVAVAARTRCQSALSLYTSNSSEMKEKMNGD